VGLPPFRSRAARAPSVLQPGQKNLSLAKKAQTPIHVMFWGQYDEKFLCDI
jgi:hypothetical protein